MGHLQTKENLSKQGKTFPNKEKPFQTKENLSKQEKHHQTRKNLSKQGKTFPNKKKHHQTRKNTTKQENRLSSKKNTFQNKKNTFRARKRLSSKQGYLPLKYRSLQVVGVFRQGKAVVSDGGYGVIGGRYCLLVWGDAEETKGKRGRRWRGVGPAGRPFPILLWR